MMHGEVISVVVVVGRGLYVRRGRGTEREVVEWGGGGEKGKKEGRVGKGGCRRGRGRREM